MTSPALLLLLGVVAAALAFFVLRPERGLLWRWLEALRKTERVELEDALKHLYHREYSGQEADLHSLAGVLAISTNQASVLLRRLESQGLVSSRADSLELTPDGRDYALRIIRVHRLWEHYLAEHTGVPETEWHGQAEQREHMLDVEQTEALSARLGHPRFDPHGDPIPTAGGDIAPPRGQPLSTLDEGQRATVVHVEDEPDAVYAQIVAEGLTPGMHLRVLETGPRRLRCEVEGNECVLAPVVARNVSVVPVAAPEAEAAQKGVDRLSSLRPGDRARVVDLSRACYGQQRRRLLDLGLVPGTEVVAEFASPSGDPVAYRIRGASIALRREQADLVQVDRTEEVAS